MKHEDIIRLAIEHTIHGLKFDEEGLVRFANLVAQHTLSNIDPSSFMTWQEGYEVGKQTEREACAKVCDSLEEQCEKLLVPDEKWPTPADCANIIRARGQA
jgi:hypothetical protein